MKFYLWDIDVAGRDNKYLKRDECIDINMNCIVYKSRIGSYWSGKPREDHTGASLASLVEKLN